jgi:hypothetical protein
VTASANKLRIGARRHPLPLRRALAGAILLAAAGFAASHGIAQTARGITIKVPPVVVAEAAGQVPFPIQIEPADAIPRNSFVRLRGLPPMAALSEGYVIGAGSWAVPISALPDLKLSLPVATTGRTEVSVLLVAVDGAVLVETKTALSVGSGQAANQVRERPPAAAGASMLRAGAPVDLGPSRQEPTAAAPPLVPRSVPQDRERAMRLLAKGNEQLEEGNISAARLFYERAADAGLAEGAMALAATFDGAELGRLSVRGIKADPKQARQWYERARQLGAREAEERLRRLGAN